MESLEPKAWVIRRPNGKHIGIAILVILFGLIGWGYITISDRLEKAEIGNGQVQQYLNTGVGLGIFPSGNQLTQIANQKASSTQK